MQFFNIGIVDIIFILLAGISMLFAYSRGFIKEIFSTTNWIIAGWLALTYYKEIKHLFEDLLSSEILSEICAFLIIFIFSVTVGTLINQFITGKLKQSSLAPLDKMLGVFFGIIRALVIASIIYLLALNTIWKTQPIPDWFKNTYSFTVIKQSADVLGKILQNPKNLKFNEIQNKNSKIILDRLIEPPIEGEKNEDGYNASEREGMDRLFNLEATEEQ